MGGFGGSVNSPLLAFQEVGHFVVERLWLLDERHVPRVGDDDEIGPQMKSSSPVMTSV